jgi:hypothetical protein
VTTDQWAEFLAKRFSGTEYEAKPAEYWGWCAAGVDSNDDPEDVAEAWKEGCDDPEAKENP